MLCPRSQGRKLKPPRGTLYNRIWKLLQYCKIFHLITILDCYMMAMKKGESKISQNTASSMVFFVNFFYHDSNTHYFHIQYTAGLFNEKSHFIHQLLYRIFLYQDCYFIPGKTAGSRGNSGKYFFSLSCPYIDIDFY